MNPATPQSSIRHDEAWELLPWLATDRLTPAQLRGVLHHLEHSPALRQELRYLAELERAVTHPLVDEDQHSVTRLSPERVLQRIDRIATDARPARDSLLHRLRRRFEAVSRSPLVVAQTAAIAVLLFLVVTPGPEVPSSAESPAAPAYRTLTGTAAQTGTFEASAEPAHVRLVVDARLSLAALGDLLDSVDATLVEFQAHGLPLHDRPSPAGATPPNRILTLALAPRSDLETALDALRAAPSVALAEPAQGAL
ncbi:MAG: hypothetical protein AAGC60_15245 [Acidobacteriota bacterium]